MAVLRAWETACPHTYAKQQLPTPAGLPMHPHAGSRRLACASLSSADWEERRKDPAVHRHEGICLGGGLCTRCVQGVSQTQSPRGVVCDWIQTPRQPPQGHLKMKRR